jgi:hypothetical protein
MKQYIELTEVLSKTTRPVIINMALVVALHPVNHGTRLRLAASSENSIDVSEDMQTILKLIGVSK